MGRVTKRLTANLTEAQYAAFRATMQALHKTNESAVLRTLLERFVTIYGPGWPDEKIKWGGSHRSQKNSDLPIDK